MLSGSAAASILIELSVRNPRLEAVILSRSRRYMVFEVSRNQAHEVVAGAASFEDSMRAVGIIHEIEGLAELNEFIDEQFCTLIMHVVIARAVYHQQMTLKPIGKAD